MKIAVNARLLLANRLEGIGWYAYHILKNLVKNHPTVTFYFFFDRQYDEGFVFGANVIPVVVSPQARHPLLYALWFDFQLPRLLKKYEVDIFYSPEGICPLKTSVPCVITIHDLAYIHYPEGIDATHLWFYKKFQKRFAQKANHIVTVSQYTKKDIETQYDISSDKLTVTYNAAHDAYRPLDNDTKESIRNEYADGRQYFLFVGALHPRKNIINMLKAFVKFKRRQKCGFKLIIVGRLAWLTDDIQEAKERMPYREDVVWLGYKNIAELSKIMGAAYALIFPSFFEGFGIPIIEAQACGVPSIISETSSMPEVAGSAALSVDPHSIDDIADKMGIIYKDEILRERLANNCKIEIQRFDWGNSAAEVWDVIQGVSKNIG